MSYSKELFDQPLVHALQLFRIQRLSTMINKLSVCVLAVALSSLTMTASAFIGQAGPDQKVGNLPYEHIVDLLSAPGESEQSFLLRVAPQLRTFSDKTGFESCAEVAQSLDGSSFGLVLGSSLGHMGCAVYTSNIPAGMVATGRTIHSHGSQHVFKINTSDKAMMSPEDADRLSTSRRNTFAGQSVDHFSPTDYAAGPGYLATPKGLIYQNGVNLEKAIAAAK